MKNQDTITETLTNPILPLKGEGNHSAKIIGILLLIIFVIFANYMLLHHSKRNVQTTSAESYNLTEKNPITKTENINKSFENTKSEGIAVDAEAIHQKQLEEKIAQQKAQDFVDRLQATQSSGIAANSSYDTSVVPESDNKMMFNNHSAFDRNAMINVRDDNPNTAFLLRASNSKEEREYATHFGPLPYVIGQGKFIFGTLTTAINSDLPGQVAATVSQDIYGEQGNIVLIPRGSRLIGQYRSGLANNQSRLFIVWTRVIEPNGVDISLGSEGTDELGRAGMTGQVDYHFFDRFGSALLISMIGAGAANIGVSDSTQFNSAAEYRSGVASAMSDQAKSMLNQNIAIPPTINIAQGQKIVVFVNRDLDFSGVYR